MAVLSGPRVHVGERKGHPAGKQPERDRIGDAVLPALRLTILIVDDVQETRDMYRHFLEWLGHRVVVAEDGVAALQAVLHERFDIVVLDLAMPRISGWEVLQSVRREPKTQNVPVLVLSGQRERDSALAAGADAYCEKPCVPAALLLEIQRAIAASMRRSK